MTVLADYSSRQKGGEDKVQNIEKERRKKGKKSRAKLLFGEGSLERRNNMERGKGPITVPGGRGKRKGR